MPNVVTELLAMAATTVARWARNATTFERALGDILLGHADDAPVWVTLGVKAAVSRRLGSSMWSTGVRVLTDTQPWGRTVAHTAGVRSCAATLDPELRAEWTGGTLLLNGEYLRGAEITALLTPTKADGLTFCAEWLPFCSTTRDGRLLDESGGLFKLAGTAQAAGASQL